MGNDALWDTIQTSLPDMNQTEAAEFIDSYRERLTLEIDWLIAKAADRESLRTVLECLGCLKSAQGVPLLLHHLSDWDEKVQLCAAGALKQYDSDVWLKPLLDMFLNQKAPAARIGDVLAAESYKAGTALIRAYPKAAPELKVQILDFLIQNSDDRCEPLAYLALEDEGADVKKMGLRAVEVMGLRSLWGNVARLLTHEFWVLRGRAVQVLASMGVTEVSDRVRPLTSDKDPWVRQCAVRYMQSLFPEFEGE
jgi:HEAT repeat protein